jgi:hypothetical protein
MENAECKMKNGLAAVGENAECEMWNVKWFGRRWRQCGM